MQNNLVYKLFIDRIHKMHAEGKVSQFYEHFILINLISGLASKSDIILAAKLEISQD